MKINTKKLQALVSKALRGAGLNKIIPITSFVGIRYYMNPVPQKMVLELKTTDGTNYLTLSELFDGDVSEEISGVVEVEQLSRLISKLTCEVTELTIDQNKNTLHIHGNGDYDISLQHDENGNEIEFPDPVGKFVNLGSLALTTVLESIAYCKSSLAVTMEEPVYTNYYVGKEIVTTDISKICKLAKSVFEEPRLISSAVMELLGIVEEENINVSVSDKYIKFSTDMIQIVGSIVNGINDYQIDAIDNLLNQQYPNSCEVNKDVLFNALDRVSLFIDNYDNDGVKLIFKKGELVVQNLKTTGIESIKLKDQKATDEFSCIAPNTSLMDMLKSVSEEFVEIQYGESNAIKLIHGDVVQILALLEE